MKHSIRLFLMILICSSILLLGGLYLLERQRLQIEQSHRRSATLTTLVEARLIFSEQLDNLRANLLVIAAAPDVREMLDDPDTAALARVGEAFINLMRHHPQLDQIRWIDEQGWERLRGQKTPDGPVLLPRADLQDKANRGYVIAGRNLARGEVFVSALDLNIEHGQVERPLKPMIRLVTPVYDGDGQRQGMLVINIRARHLLDVTVGLLEGAWGEPMVLNREGFWLYHRDPALRWGFVLDHGQGFPAAYPAAWEVIGEQIEGEVSTAHGKFFFTTEVLSANQVKILTHVPASALGLHPWREHRGQILALLAVAAVVSLVVTRLYFMVHRETERRQREAQLFADLFRSTPEATLLVDAYGVIQRANPPAGELFGWEASALVGEPVEVLIPAQLRQRHRDYVRDYLRQPRPCTMGQRLDLWGLTRQGRELPLEVMLKPLFLADGMMVVVAIRDMSAQREARQVLQEARQAAEASDRAKSEFLANMSHEIRTPLNAVIGFAELLGQEAGTPRQRRFVEGIVVSAQNLLRLINDILDLSKIEAGRMPLDSAPVDPRRLCREIHQVFVSMAESKGLHLVLDLDPALPGYLLLDGTRVRQVLLNLLGNALKFTETGQVRLHVHGMPGETPDTYRLILEVSDTGVGIAPEAQRHIFDSFTQLPTRTEHRLGSTGLGLAITRRLVELMAGDLSLVSQPGEGTRFRVEIPVAIAVAAASAAEPEAETSTTVSFHPARVLLVEDMAYNREVVRELLRDQPLEIIEAENGEQALNSCREQAPDLVLMDMRMPVMDGYEASRRLKADPRLAGIPLVALTAAGADEGREDASQLWDSYLRKPVTTDGLLATLMKFLPHERQAPSGETSEPAPVIVDPLPGALVRQFREQVLPAHQALRGDRSLRRLGALARQLEALGEAHGVDWLTDYGRCLAAAVAGCRIGQINRLLTEFQTIQVRVLDEHESPVVSAPPLRSR